MTERELMRRVNRGAFAGILWAWGCIALTGHVVGVNSLSGIKVAIAIAGCLVASLIYFGATNGYTGDE